MNNSDVNRILSEMRQKKRKRKRIYGDVKPIIETDGSGKKFIAVGNIVYYSDKWSTFPDFLFEYLWYVFGKKWFDAELVKSPKSQHPVMQWWFSLHRFHEQQEKLDVGVFGVTPTGPMKAFLTLSYDLYLLNHHSTMPKIIVERLKNIDQFQGARYELFATTTMIRSGFDIEYEDEEDGLSKHVEFTAIHKKTGEKIAIEAMSRHRNGILSFQKKKLDIKKTRIRVGKLINQAINKEPKIPFIIFIDLNLHPDDIVGFADDPSLRELIKSVDTVRQDELKKDYFNAIFYTNHPYHYGDDYSPYAKDHLSAVISQKQKYPLSSMQLIETIQKAIMQHRNIPNEFDEG